MQERPLVDISIANGITLELLVSGVDAVLALLAVAVVLAADRTNRDHLLMHARQCVCSSSRDVHVSIENLR